MAILVSKRMDRSVPQIAASRLERSCGPSPGDWIRLAPAQDGLERIEAFFHGHAFDPHRHDTYAIGCTLSGVQSFDYHGARADSLAGDAIVLHPDDTHDGRAGAEAGFSYRMLYVQPRLISEALADRSRSLPLACSAVSADSRIKAAISFALDDLDRPLESLERDQAIVALADALLALDGSSPARNRGGVDSLAVDRARRFSRRACRPDGDVE
jgi:hypothetical protein